MDCERFADEKLLRVHNEIGTVPPFEAHLETCAACRIDIEEMRDVLRRYHAVSGEPMSDDLRARILARRPAASPGPAWQRWIPIAAAALLIVALVVPLVRAPAPE